MKKFLLLSFLLVGMAAYQGSAQMLYKNGNIGTGAVSSNGVTAPAGTEWSEAQSDGTLANGNSGFSAAYNATKTIFLRLADDFTVPLGEKWSISLVRVFAYQTGSAAATAPFDGLRVQIYDGNPATGGSVISGDTVTNVLSGVIDTMRYRVFNGTASATTITRKIWGLNANMTVDLMPGTYWLEWSVKATNNANNFCPPANVVGVRGLPSWNAVQYGGGTTWVAVRDSVAGAPAVPQDFPFEIVYTATTLPIKLSSFQGVNKGGLNLLIWTTETEQNNKGFELQRSLDGKEFSPVTFVNSKAIAGTSTSKISYQYIDENSVKSTTYYRLKQIDFDGKSTFSGIVAIKGDKVSGISLSNIYPNPVKTQLKAILTASSNDKVSLIITDINGKIVMEHSATSVAGDKNILLNVAKLPAGSYVIKATSGNESAVSKFVKD